MTLNPSDTQLKQLKYHSWHRGTRENDLLLGKFADATLSHFDKEMICLYQQFLNETDHDIFSWIMEQQPAPHPYSELIEIIRHYHDKL